MSPTSRVIQIRRFTLFCIHLKSLTLWSLLVAPLALKMTPNSLRGSRKFASANLCPPPVSYHSFSHQTPHSYIHSTLSYSVICGSPKYPPSLSPPGICLEHLSPSLYLANLHSLGSRLENASFLILEDWVKRPHWGLPGTRQRVCHSAQHLLLAWSAPSTLPPAGKLRESSPLLTTASLAQCMHRSGFEKYLPNK